MSFKNDTCNNINLSSGVSFTDNIVCNGKENTFMNTIVSNDTSLITLSSQTNSQENTVICNSANELYNVSTVYGSVKNDSLYNDTTFNDNFSNLHDDIPHDLNMNSLYNNVTLSSDNTCIHNLNNNSSTCAQNLEHYPI